MGVVGYCCRIWCWSRVFFYLLSLGQVFDFGGVGCVEVVYECDVDVDFGCLFVGVL